MIRFLISAAIYVVTAVLGLLIASWLLEDFTLQLTGFIIAVALFALAQGLLAPFIVKMARKYAPGVLGVVGLITTFASLLIASLFSNGLVITGFVTWVLATLIVWVVSALGGWLLPLIFLREKTKA